MSCGNCLNVCSEVNLHIPGLLPTVQCDSVYVTHTNEHYMCQDLSDK